MSLAYSAGKWYGRGEAAKIGNEQDWKSGESALARAHQRSMLNDRLDSDSEDAQMRQEIALEQAKDRNAADVEKAKYSAIQKAQEMDQKEQERAYKRRNDAIDGINDDYIAGILNEKGFDIGNQVEATLGVDSKDKTGLWHTKAMEDERESYVRRKTEPCDYAWNTPEKNALRFAAGNEFLEKVRGKMKDEYRSEISRLRGTIQADAKANPGVDLNQLVDKYTSYYIDKKTGKKRQTKIQPVKQ